MTARAVWPKEDCHRGRSKTQQRLQLSALMLAAKDSAAAALLVAAASHVSQNS
jgi:hypothetical protein